MQDHFSGKLAERVQDPGGWLAARIGNCVIVVMLLSPLRDTNALTCLVVHAGKSTKNHKYFCEDGTVKTLTSREKSLFVTFN